MYDHTSETENISLVKAACGMTLNWLCIPILRIRSYLFLDAHEEVFTRFGYKHMNHISGFNVF